MSIPFQFQPEKPVASTRPSVIREYSCHICSKIRPARDMYYDGPFMAVIRDKSRFACKDHLE